MEKGFSKKKKIKYFLFSKIVFFYFNISCEAFVICKHDKKRKAAEKNLFKNKYFPFSLSNRGRSRNFFSFLMSSKNNK